MQEERLLQPMEKSMELLHELNGQLIDTNVIFVEGFFDCFLQLLIRY